MSSIDQPRLVRDLMRPSAYPQPLSGTVDLRCTHASWVFMVGDDVWKVKRPVDYGFLDFRTAEARRACCEDEVRLNRRLAPDVYLGVEPVRFGSSGYALTNDDRASQIVDWAVHMRRLPDDASARYLLSKNKVGATRLRALAARMATFLSEAPRRTGFADLESLHSNVADNFQGTLPFVGDLVDEATYHEALEFQIGQLRNYGERFARRARDGRCREGHGDLRLEHVYFLKDADGYEQPIVIDCIEFSERFRCGDTAGEAAFLAMELELEWRPDLASAWIARFAEASDDFGLYGVLDFYLSYRAWVRGKVAALVAADPTTSTPIRDAKRREARRDFAMARSFAGEPLDKPFVIAVGGLIGAGKSTLAQVLGDALAVPVVSSDRTRKAQAGLPVLTRGDADLYTEERIGTTYEEILRRAAEVLASGRGVVLDASFSKRRWRQAAAALAARAALPCVFMEARCPNEQVLRARLRARGNTTSESDARDDLLDRFKASYEPVVSGEPGAHVTVNTGGAILARERVFEGLRSAGITPAAERFTSAAERFTS